MRPVDRILSRISNVAPYRPGTSARFDDLVVKRKSWAYWFVARSVGAWGKLP